MYSCKSPLSRLQVGRALEISVVCVLCIFRPCEERSRFLYIMNLDKETLIFWLLP